MLKLILLTHKRQKMIREVQIEDLKQLQNLAKQLFKMHFIYRPDVYYDRHCVTAKYLLDLIDNPAQKCFVYVEENKILGYILVKEINSVKNIAYKNNKIWEIENIVVDQQRRNQHIGQALFDYAEELAIKNKVFSIEVNVFAFNTTAIHFHESMGMNAKKIRYEKLINKKYCQKTNTITIRNSDKTI